MEPAKVYFSDLRTDEISTLEKLRRLMKAAGFEQIDFKDKYVAVKLHFGEPGNMAYLRPNWARVVCDYVRALGGKPFLTDCNTLYVGGRANALDHLDSAMRNGYSPMTTGAQCIIADGLKGGDYDLVPIRGGKYLRAAKIGRAIMDADIFISLTHAKGHESTGFGGALKNIGMGCGSRAGKEEMHSSGKPVVDQDKCIGCGKCIENCAHNGPHIENGKCTILKFKCTGCGRCVHVCPMHAIHPDYDIANDVLNCKIAEYAKAVVDGRPSFHIALALDVKPKEVLEMEERLYGQETSLDTPSNADDDSDNAFTPSDWLTRESDEPEAILEEKEHQRLEGEGLQMALRSLDERSRRIITARYLNLDKEGNSKAVTLQELANEFGVSAERIRQIEKLAIQKMRQTLEQAHYSE